MVNLVLASMYFLINTTSVLVEMGVYEDTASRWTHAVMKGAEEPSTTFIKKLQIKDGKHKNGSRDYIVWAPANVGTTDKTIGIMWFHGHTGFSERTFNKRIVKQFSPHMTAKDFFVVIPEMPWSWNTSTRTKRNGRIWQKKGEFTAFVKRVESDVKELGVHNIEWRVVGHSAGGSTLATVGSTGDLCRMNPTKIVWSDSTYGYWLEKATSGCLKDFKMDVHIVSSASKTSRSAKRFKNTLAGKNTTIHEERFPHLLIGDNIVKLSNLLEVQRL